MATALARRSRGPGAKMELWAKWRAVVPVCLLVAVSVAGCGSDIPTAPTTPTPTPNPNPYDGYWAGTTSEGRQVIFRVIGSSVVQMTLYFNVTSSCSAWETISTTGPIQNGAFTMPVTSSLTTSPVTVTGTFGSNTTMSGTIGATTITAGAGCDTTADTPKAAMTYTAQQ